MLKLGAIGLSWFLGVGCVAGVQADDKPGILLYRYVDTDKTLLQKILVDNPARLHRF